MLPLRTREGGATGSAPGTGGGTGSVLGRAVTAVSGRGKLRSDVGGFDPLEGFVEDLDHMRVTRRPSVRQDNADQPHAGALHGRHQIETGRVDIACLDPSVPA